MLYHYSYHSCEFMYINAVHHLKPLSILKRPFMLEPIHVMQSIQYRYTTTSCGTLYPHRPYS